MIELEISGGPEAVEGLGGFPDRLNARLAGVMRTIGAALRDRVRDKLGGQVLRKRSGRLAAAVDFAVTSSGGDVGVSVGVADVPYAAYQEYGFHGTETVRAQLRTIKQAFGRTIAPREIAVRAFARRVDYPAHSYLRSALADGAPDAAAQIDTAAAEEIAS